MHVEILWQTNLLILFSQHAHVLQIFLKSLHKKPLSIYILLFSACTLRNQLPAKESRTATVCMVLFKASHFHVIIHSKMIEGPPLKVCMAERALSARKADRHTLALVSWVAWV